jgi:hypothetical protein
MAVVAFNLWASVLTLPRPMAEGHYPPIGVQNNTGGKVLFVYFLCGMIILIGLTQ